MLRLPLTYECDADDKPPYRCDEADDCVAVVERAVERARELEQLAQGLAQEVSDETLRELADLERLVREKVELLTEIKVRCSCYLSNPFTLD